MVKKAIIFSLIVGVFLGGRGLWQRVTALELPFITPPEIQVPPPDFDYEDYVAEYDQVREPLEPVAPDNAVPLIYGVNFISSPEYPATPNRYDNAHASGARWNRWPMYWHTIELNSDNFTWADHDAVISADIAEGFILNAILMGIPGFYFDGDRAIPNTLHEPIFSDGTDIPGPEKSININNKWAQYIYRAVDRYRPGGVLATAQGWPEGAGISYWEIWNEPDLTYFFDGTKAEYARMLKIGYLVAHHADPNANVISGAMANNFADLNYYKDVLGIIQNDPLAEEHGYFHDIMATHSYFYAWQSWFHVFRAQNAMSAFGLDKPIWLNETGIPAWNDYPGPVWDPSSQYRGTMDEQADYMIQTAFYSMFAGADAMFHFQMYDGCGNQPQGTDFPPHNGELCDANGNLISDPRFPCAGDANGLFRNETDAACFTHHPNPGSARPNFTAYQLLTQYLQDVVPLYRYKVCTLDEQSWIAFYRPNTNQRIMALWACVGEDEQAVVPAIDNGAQLITPDGNTQFIAPTNGNYYLTLPAATNTNPILDPERWPVGGRPYLLIERDLQPPTVTIDATENSDNIWVTWNGDDYPSSGIQNYDLTVSVDGGDPQAWLTGVTQTSATYTGSYQYGVEFTVIARDWGGNLSQPTSVMIGELPPVDPPVAQKFVNRDIAVPFDTLSYQITVSNWSPVANPAVHIVDELPDGIVFINGSLNASHGTATYDDGTIYWNGALNANQTLSLSFQAYVDDVANDTTIVNEAIITDDFGHNVIATATTQVLVPTATPTPSPTPTATPSPTPSPTIPPPDYDYHIHLPIVAQP